MAKKAKKEKVAIVGFAGSSIGLAPFNDDSFEIWGVNELYKVVPKVDVLFELHDYEMLANKDRNPAHLEWLRQAKIPVFMQKHFDDIPSSVPFPLDDITDEFGRYFTNTISYEIALALQLGFKEIHLYGVDMATNSEYGGQRPSVEYFLGVAVGRGVKVHIPAQCDLLKTAYLYGFEDKSSTLMAVRMKARLAELKHRMDSFAQQELSARDAKHQMIGAQDNAQYVLRSFVYRDQLQGEDG